MDTGDEIMTGEINPGVSVLTLAGECLANAEVVERKKLSMSF